MKPGATISEIADIFKEIQEISGQWFEMIRPDIRRGCREIPDGGEAVKQGLRFRTPRTCQNFRISG